MGFFDFFVSLTLREIEFFNDLFFLVAFTDEIQDNAIDRILSADFFDQLINCDTEQD